MPQGKKWVDFARWSERWGRLHDLAYINAHSNEKVAGDLIYMNLFGQPAIIVNDVDIAIAMLDKKSSIYSDRPVLVVGGQVVGFENGVALERYRDRWREKRRMMHRHISTRSSMEKFYGAEELETHRLLRRILERPQPELLPKHIRLTAGAIILMISHGYAVKEKDDYYYFVQHADRVLTIFTEALTPGRFLADTLPILRFVPEWFPGAAWKRAATTDASWDCVPSFTSMHLEQGNLSEDKEHMLKWVAHSIMAGGADTVSLEVQEKAQKELDAVVGNDRLPTINDRSRLPYIDATVKEVLRWNTVAPIGVSHGLVEDDIQDGYFIPKGSFIIPNIWKFLHDEQTYKDPFEFRPERFVASGKQGPEKDPRSAAFGFGRRVCPGLLFADSSLFLTCAMVLSMFNISKATENGVPITPKQEYVDGLISHPKPFNCSIKPRSDQAVAIIKSIDFVEE
ncbi:hypothetical protein EWM64_g4581 [Hericium alpestre]|uniref:O-methylsterigmatocystin oxidoreductase n=1 Tax=Hericium alpestre TaxID=135208 RepID=A0A4Y9ZZF6_9AGAM|nr:hypothetical protein EWM64_g4581 [Hericium alpestre]